MHDIDRLVQLITERLLEKGTTLEQKSTLYVIGEKNLLTELKQAGYVIVEDYRAADKIIVDNLSLDSLLRVAALCPTTNEETALLTGLLEGKPVWVSASILNIERYKQTSKSSLYRDLLKQKTTLEKYGVSYYEEGELGAKLSATEIKAEQPLPARFEKTPLKSVSRLVTESRLREMGLAEGDCFQLEKGMIITALAQDYLKRHKITVVK
ncbi:ethanolamine utilization protein [Streptococcus rupicaprae]|uniref:Ethanolamine utilization protein n=1 Tax=Streptococcus rupicaprae TaxID=759619 RepID=A0ABV2FF44_9STRE